MKHKKRSYIKNRLKKYRVLMGYKQKEVAELLGLKSASRISRWEKGLAMPSVENLIKLSALYSTLMNEFYFEIYNESKIKNKPLINSYVE